MKAKIFCLRNLVLAGALVLLAGCGSVEVFATRAKFAGEPKPPRLKSVLLSEGPTIVVHLPRHCDWKPQPGMLWLEDAVTGKTLWSGSAFMRPGSDYAFLPEGLRPGTYLVTLKADGETVAAMNFDVN